jgi:hypothetical protein
VAQNEFALIAFHNHGIAAAGRPKPARDRGTGRPARSSEFGIGDLSENIPVKKDGAVTSLQDAFVQACRSSEDFVQTMNLATLGLLRDFLLIFLDFNVICRRIRIPLLSHSQEIGYFCNI